MRSLRPSLRALLRLAVAAASLGTPAVASAQSPLPRGPYAQRATAASFVVRFRTAPGAPATVEYGAGDGPLAKVEEAGQESGEHAVTLAGLAAGTRYRYRVTSGGAFAEGEAATAARADQPVSFLVYGDNRSDEADHTAVVRAMIGEGADFVVNTGDAVASSTPAEWDRFFRVERELLAHTVLYPTLGNHECAFFGGPALWQRAFTTPDEGGGGGRYYHVDAGSARLVILDFNRPTAAQTAWLDATLGEARRLGLAHLFVFLHHSPYDSGEHGENEQAKAEWVPLFQKHGVDLIFGGHDHDYERGFVPETGLRYVVTGGGGAPLYDENRHASYQQRFVAALHYVR